MPRRAGRPQTCRTNGRAGRESEGGKEGGGGEEARAADAGGQGLRRRRDALAHPGNGNEAGDPAEVKQDTAMEIQQENIQIPQRGGEAVQEARQLQAGIHAIRQNRRHVHGFRFFCAYNDMPKLVSTRPSLVV